MAGEVPEGWRQKRMDEVARIVGGTTPPSDNLSFWGGHIPFVTPTDLTALEGRYLRATERSISENGRRAAGLEVLPPRSILLATRASIGLAALNDIPVTTNQGFQNLVPLHGTDPLWLFYAVTARKGEFERLAAGTTFQELSRRSLKTVELLVPPAPEQRAIARVLDAIDDAIERTEAVIAATEMLRKELLQELLTRGVPGRHTEWKQVPAIGTIPADWEVVRLGDVIAELCYGTSMALSPTHGAYAILRIPNVAHGAIDVSEVKYADLPAHEARALVLREGDLLLVRTNGNPAICGQGAVVEGLEGSWAFASYLLRLRTNPGILQPHYLWLYLRSRWGRRQLSGSIRTSAGNYNLSPAGLSRLFLPLPPMDEQVRIAQLAKSQADLLVYLRGELGRLRGLKGSAADALLAGRVRVRATVGTTG